MSKPTEKSSPLPNPDDSIDFETKHVERILEINAKREIRKRKMEVEIDDEFDKLLAEEHQKHQRNLKILDCLETHVG
ncbi:unnamed protein product [Caenorhabditis angaria]|uniref:Uncharacterized protein n=1 Tax=Caenorhabditis angaria TaxID=860376 RepID=A0A9P1N3J6_9PELO|nr:unnamed protein product [Caenorhabditis angaria]